VKSDEVRRIFLKNGFEVEGNSPDEFAATIREEVDKWKNLVKAAGIKAQ
jgi:tripartite-type tricarboxylate transporter receptor subunit TctC